MCSCLSARLMAPAVAGKRQTPYSVQVHQPSGAGSSFTMQTFVAADCWAYPASYALSVPAHRAMLEAGARVHHAASKLCILGFQTLKQSLIARTPLIKARGCRIAHWQNGFFEDVFIRTASAWPNTFTCKLKA